MNFKRIETFYWVAKLGSFRKVAEQQCTTQPAISSRIALLEEELGVQLFERDGNSKVVLTLKGRQLVRYAEKLINLSQDFSLIANQDSTYSGLLRLGVSETIAHTWLSDFLSDLHYQLPNLTVELSVDVSVNLSKQLEENTIDLAFLLGPTQAPSLVDKKLWSTPLHWFAASDLGMMDKHHSIESLAQWTIITYAKNTAPYHEVSQQFMESVDQPVQIFTSSSLSVCRHLVLDGLGISALPKELMQQDLKDGRVHLLQTQWQPSRLSFTASHLMQPNPLELEGIVELAMNRASAYSLRC